MQLLVVLQLAAVNAASPTMLFLSAVESMAELPPSPTPLELVEAPRLRTGRLFAEATAVLLLPVPNVPAKQEAALLPPGVAAAAFLLLPRAAEFQAGPAAGGGWRGGEWPALWTG